MFRFRSILFIILMKMHKTGMNVSSVRKIEGVNDEW